MPVPHRDVAERRRNERKAQSPYNSAGRQKKMKANRGWGSSIWGALSWVTGRKPSNEEEESEDEEETRETNMSMEDTQHDSDASAMNLSTMSEDQVLTQLTMRDPRQVRFDFASSLGRVHSNEAGPSTPVRPPPVPYVAPVPPSVAQKQASPPFENPIEKVTEYLQTTVIPRGGQCTDVEALGLSLLLQSAVSKLSPSSSTSSQYQGSPDRIGRDALAFAGLTTPSPLKPTFTKPDTDIASVLMASTSSDGSPSRPSPGRPSAARTLAHNPNGQLVFSGGGSARPRYRSPSFGSPSPSRNRNAFPRNFGAQKQAEPPASPSDGKRRRVGEEKDTSVAQPSGSPVAAAPQGSQANGIKVNGTANGTTSVTTAGPSRSTTTASTSNLPRFGVLRYNATTPARPSPLRQSVRADSSSPGSPSENANGVNGAASTRAGQIMASIISNASPTKPDRNAETESIEAIQNPYAAGRNTRKRTKPPTKPKQSPRPHPAKTVSPAPPVPKKPTAAELIEMTAPTGSKRSHESVKTNGTTKPSPFKPTVVEVVDEDDEPKAKKQRAEDKGKEKAEAPAQEVINLDEDDDIVMTSGSSEPLRPSEIIEPGDTPKGERKESEANKPPFGIVPPPKAGKFPSAPKEPSPLRQSFQPEEAAKPAPAPASLFGFGSTTTTTSNPGGMTTQSTTTSTFGSSSSTSIFGSSTTTTTGSRPTFGLSSTPSLFGSASAITAPSTTSPFGTAPAGGNVFGTAPAATFADASKKEEAATKPAASFFGGLKTTTTPVPKDEEKGRPAETGHHPLFGPAAATTSTSLFGASAPAVTQKPEDDLAAAKKEALSAPSSTLPKYDFKIPSGSGTSFLAEYPEAQRAALAIPASELPKYTFDIPKASTSTSTSTFSTPITTSANTSMPQSAIDTAQKKGFDWSAAGMKKPEVTGWKCSVCDVPNKDTAEKCAACETPKPGSEAKPKAPAGFNWGAAGMKKPEVTGWKCSVCDVPNKDTAEKCVACETPKPGSEAKPKAPVDFNWGAAGMKKPETAGWKCEVCMVQNKDSDVTCVSCTADKPGGAPAEDKAKSPPTAASGFNWAAAGMKPPQAEPGWRCDSCMVRNKDDAVKCVACESDKPGSKIATASPAPAAVTFGGFGGFSGFKPAATSSESKPAAGGFTPSGGFAPGGGFTFGGSKATTTSTSITAAPSKGGFTPSFGSGSSSTSASSLFGSGLTSTSSTGGFTPSLFGTGTKPVGFTPLFGAPKPAEEKDKEKKD